LIRKLAITIAVVFLASATAYAAGGHESLGCTGCHDIHAAKGPIIFAVEANKVLKAKKTNQPYQGVAALCLGCHAAPEQGGMGIKPISQHTTHPFGDKPNAKVARVPRQLLRDGRMDCVSCHDPHPSNPNYRYLRTDTKGGSEMSSFCAVCHPAKAESAVAKKAAKATKVFTSMDELKGATTVSLSAYGNGGKKASTKKAGKATRKK